MKFTDEDIKRVKEELKRIESSSSSLPIDELVVDVTYSEIKSLLARLEAAENVVKLTAIDMKHFKETSKLYLYPTLEAIEAWRESKGA